jgi:hypothetical protein
MKNKVYKIIPTKEQKRIIKCYWHKMKEIENEFYARINDLEKELERETDIKEIEFFFCDNECVGIGNVERTMELIHGEDLK